MVAVAYGAGLVLGVWIGAWAAVACHRLRRAAWQAELAGLRGRVAALEARLEAAAAPPAAPGPAGGRRLVLLDGGRP